MLTVEKYTLETLSSLDKNISGIYKITHDYKPGIFYIGSAVSIRYRWFRHVLDLNRESHCTQYLQRTVLKYGVEGLRFQILEVVEDKSLLTQTEQKWLNNSDPNCLYNSCLIVGTTLGFKMTEQQRHNKRKERLGYKHTEETKARMSESAKGHKRNVGKKNSEETKIKRKMSCYENSQINATDVIFIKGLISAGYTQKQIAKLYSISKSTIGNININKTWGHVILPRPVLV